MNRSKGVQLMLFITLFLLISAVIPSTVNSAPPITQKTWTVDITGNGDFTSIQQAIDNAAITDIIFIRNGVYNEHDLIINKKIELLGENQINTVINCSGNHAFNLESSYVDISNLQITNTKDYAISILPESVGCTITDCIINTNIIDSAIDIRSSYNTVSGCRLTGLDNSKQGVKIHGSFNIVSDCEVQDFTNGVLIILDSNENQILNCNIINNENGVDIRDNSNENIVSGCNIFSNLQSIKIWQNSNNNKIYLNNFWKNDIDAIDQDNNTWDNGVKGNYWDKYRGVDANSDGIGDTPYTISEGNIDNYPLMELITPDLVPAPGNVRITTSKSDNTPSFAWSPSVYSKGIKAYYVKIDNNPERSVGDTTSWTTSTSLFDGVHTFNVRAESVDDKSSNYSTITFVIDTTIIDTDGDGWSDSLEQQYGTDPNNPDNYPLDTDNDHIPNSVDTDDDNDEYSDDMENSYGTDPTDINSYPLDTDHDGIPDNNSPDGKYTGDEDDDNDGLSDTIEASIGTNPKSASDVKIIYINGKQYYLIDVTQNGIFDFLYDSTTNTKYAVEKQDGTYLLDTTGDGNWNYIFTISDESIEPYPGVFGSIALWIVIILAIILPVSIILFLFIRKRTIKLIRPKKEEIVTREQIISKPYILPPLETKDTTVMIRQTKTLLQHIQKDVKVYMDQLQQLEEQFMIPTKEEETKILKQEPVKIEDIKILEDKVDKLLSNKEKEEKE